MIIERTTRGVPPHAILLLISTTPVYWCLDNKKIQACVFLKNGVQKNLRKDSYSHDKEQTPTLVFYIHNMEVQKIVKTLVNV